MPSRRGPAFISFVVVAICALPIACATTNGRVGARESARLTIVRAGAEWCAPCHRMAETTWRDDRVVALLEAHAAVVDLDIDREPDERARFAIGAVPTTIALREGLEVGRFVGYRDAAWTAEWIDGIVEGRSSLAILESRAERSAADTPEGWTARLEYAQALAAAGREGDAAPIACALWTAYGEVEGAPEVLDLEPRFVALLERLASAGVVDAGDLLESEDEAPSWRARILVWSVVGDDAAVVAWYERHATDPAADATIRSCHEVLRRSAATVGRWDVVLAVVERFVPVTTFARNRLAVDPIAERLTDESRAAMEADALADVTTLHRACVETGRDEDAQRIRAMLVERFGEAPMRAIESAGE